MKRGVTIVIIVVILLVILNSIVLINQNGQEEENTEQEVELEPQTFIITADDAGFYINSREVEEIAVAKGNKINILFKVSADHRVLEFGGLSFGGCGEYLGRTNAGKSGSINFTASKSCEIESFWPEINRSQQVLKVRVI